MVKKWLLGIGLTVFTLASLISAQTLSRPQGDKLAQTSVDFTHVAKEAIPAVVWVKIKAPARQKEGFSNAWGFDDDLNDFFRNDFFKHFFRIPDKEDDQHQPPTIGQASGFLVSSDGYILTNSHVIKDAGEISVMLNDGREFLGKVIGQDPNTDIAIIKIEAKDLPYLTLGNSDALQVGQWAIAIGNPLQLQATLTVGVISATGRNNLDLARIEDFIQTDAAINRGNSGGPLLNLDAEVIGMNTAIFTNMSSGGYMGIGFAIPSNLLKHIMQEIINSGTVIRGFLGVILQQMDQNLARAFNLDKTEGALVAEVSKDSPAEQAGIKQGDIILRYNKSPVNNIAALRNAIALMSPGTKITLTILRDNQSMEIPISIGAFPVETSQEIIAVESEGNKYGFSVQDLTADLAKKLGYEEQQGVIISRVDAGSPAAWAGLKKGVLITSLNQKKVNSAKEFNKILEELESNKPILLLIKQGDSTRFVSLQAD